MFSVDSKPPFTASASISKKGFSLIEVVLAIGIFLVTVLALVGLIGPTLKSIEDVEDIDAISSVVNTVNSFLQNSPSIAGTTASKFDVIYNAVAGQNFATIFVFDKYINTTDDGTRLMVGFTSTETLSGASVLGAEAVITAADLDEAAGKIYRVVLTPSSVLPSTTRSATRDTLTNTYTLSQALASYLEGYFAMEVRIYAEESGPGFVVDRTLAELVDLKPVFKYNTAVVR